VVAVAERGSEADDGVRSVATKPPYVAYWNYMPAPYMVDRFNVLATRGNLRFEAWFSARREPHWSGAWTVDEQSWAFEHRYLPHAFIRGWSVGFPPALLKPGAPDVLVSPHGQPSFVGGWAVARARGIRTVFWVVKTFESWIPRRAYSERIKREMLSRTDAIFVPGDDAREYALRYGARDDRIFTVAHPIDSGFVRAAGSLSPDDRLSHRSKLGITGTAFLYVGRLWWGKGVKYLISAFAALQQAGADVSLLLVGDGEERSDLEKMVRKLSLRNVIFAGFREKEDLARWYASADVFVFPSLGDPFGLVVGEAMASGLPVITTSAVGELRDRVEQGQNGFIVPPADGAQLAMRMRQLVSMPTLVQEMGAIAREKAEGRTAERWSADFEEAIERVLCLTG
jgi:glycosyltransferase involved in cell wall biosynthesis